MAKQLRNLLFLRSTGVLIGEITPDTDESVLDLANFYVKAVHIDEEAGEYWFGDYATGQVQSRLDKPVITESALKFASNVKVLTEYPIHKQLNILIDMLDKSNVEKTPDFIAMKAFLDQVRDFHQQKKAVYSSNDNAYVWISQEQERAEADKKSV